MRGLNPGQQPADQPPTFGNRAELPPDEWTEQEWRDVGWYINDESEWVAPTPQRELVVGEEDYSDAEWMVAGRVPQTDQQGEIVLDPSIGKEWWKLPEPKRQLG